MNFPEISPHILQKIFQKFLIFLLIITAFAPLVGSVAFADGQKDTVIYLREPLPGQSDTIDVSVERGSLNILSDYVSEIFRFVAALSVIIAVLILMGAGFKMMLAGGDTGARDEAKEWIQKVFMGLAFLFLAGLFLKTVNPHFYLLN